MLGYGGVTLNSKRTAHPPSVLPQLSLCRERAACASFGALEGDLGSEGGRVSWETWGIWLWLVSQEHLLAFLPTQFP